MSAIDEAKQVLANRFEKAADQAEADLKPILAAALTDLRKHFDVESVEEAMGITMVKFVGRHAGCYEGNFSHYRDVDDPHYCTMEAFDALQDFMELTSLVGDYRLAFCLYGRLQ